MIKIRRRVLNICFILTLTILAFGLLFKQKSDFYLPLYILVTACSAYLIWALIFHRLDKSLTLPIYLEYVLTAVLVSVLLVGVLF